MGLIDRMRESYRERQVNRLLKMKAKTRAYKEANTQYSAEQKVRKEYASERAKAKERTVIGQVKKGLKNLSEKNARSRNTSKTSEPVSNHWMFSNQSSHNNRSKKKTVERDDTFKKWGF